MARLKPVCKYFLQGQCAYGDRCRFRHDEGEAGFVQQRTSRIIGPSNAIKSLVGDDIKAIVFTGVADTDMDVDFLLESDTALRIVDLKTSLEFTWYRPSRNIWLTFSSQTAANRAKCLVNNDRINDFQLQGSVQPPGTSSLLQISNVPDCISDKQVRTRYGKDCLTFRSGGLSYVVSDTGSLQAIRRAIGHVTSRHIKAICTLPSKNPLRLKAEVVFDGAPRLDGHAKRLEGHRMEGFGGTKVFATERMVVGLRLRQSLYEGHVRKLKSTASEIYRDLKVQVSMDDGPKDPTNNVAGPHEIELSLRSTDRKAMMEAKARLDRILTWDMTGHLTGAKRPSRQTHRIRLTKTKSFKLVLKTIAEAQDEFGRDVVKFDKNSDPPAVVVLGDSTMLRKVQTYLSLHTSRKKPECVICEDATDDVVRTRGCCHIACRGCFLAYCTTDVESKLPLKCFASECGVLIPFDQLHSQLSKADLSRIINESVYQHIKQNTNTFGSCPGADCEARFTIDSVRRKHICPKCFTVGCPTCKVEYHDGETCEEYAGRMKREEDEGMRSYMEQAGAKPCPNCGHLCEKAAGCNNMECLSCRIHFCWRCLHVEKTHQGVYAHLNKEHGGFFDNVEEEQAIRREHEAEDRAARAQMNGRMQDLVAAREQLDALREVRRQA